MDFLKKRSVALVILGVIVVVFSIFGVNRSMSSLAEKTEKFFYSGVGTETPIDTYLTERINAAKMLTIIAKNYSDLDSLSSKLYDVYNNLYAAKGIHNKYEANDIMQNAYIELYSALKSLSGVTEKNLADAKVFAETMDNIQDKIERSTYNREVDKYYVTLNTFPIILYKLVIFTSAPERFA